jgi:hypothetical protein
LSELSIKSCASLIKNCLKNSDQKSQDFSKNWL